MNKKSFCIGDRVAVNGRYVGRVDFFTSSGRILVRDDAGTIRAWYPNELQLVDPRSEEGELDEGEEPPACATLQKLEEALECLDGLLGPKCSKRLLRVRDLVASAASDFFDATPDQAVELASDPQLTRLVSDPPF
jgi:hypothetical protein